MEKTVRPRACPSRPAHGGTNGYRYEQDRVTRLKRRPTMLDEAEQICPADIPGRRHKSQHAVAGKFERHLIPKHATPYESFWWVNFRR